MVRNHLTPETVNKLLYIQINRRTFHREHTVKDEDEDEEEEEEKEEEEQEQEEPLGHTIEAQECSEDLPISSQDELQV